jgi:shikimate dehydrogenase
MTSISGAALIAGVAGSPVRHSLSPLIHNAWIAAAGLDAAYVPFAPPPERFEVFIEGLRGGVIRGLNVTLPFKEKALAAADRVSDRARAAEAANLLVFEADGTVSADNTDGLGMLGAFAAQAPAFRPTTGPVVILGAGGAARGAAEAFVTAGAPQVRLVNRTASRAHAIADSLSGPIVVYGLSDAAAAFDGATAVINATSAGLSGQGALDVPLQAAPKTAVVMDMVYKPLITPFLAQARDLGLATVDGLEMLIRQAMPSFEAFFGQAPPESVDVRALALNALGGRP